MVEGGVRRPAACEYRGVLAAARSVAWRRPISALLLAGSSNGAWSSRGAWRGCAWTFATRARPLAEWQSAGPLGAKTSTNYRTSGIFVAVDERVQVDVVVRRSASPISTKSSRPCRTGYRATHRLVFAPALDPLGGLGQQQGQNIPEPSGTPPVARTRLPAENQGIELAAGGVSPQLPERRMPLEAMRNARHAAEGIRSTAFNSTTLTVQP